MNGLTKEQQDKLDPFAEVLDTLGSLRRAMQEENKLNAEVFCDCALRRIKLLPKALEVECLLCHVSARIIVGADWSLLVFVVDAADTMLRLLRVSCKLYGIV